ncbi:MAG TPA: acyl-CoA thioesterase [Candidatus Borkfalkia excrementipullorum]|nr:acyl-CoA thioesterase [Candidatus Borkfalkia excrementipullorum]
MQFKPYRHKVQYYETDTMKIVHHSNYIRWMEEARVDMLEQMGLGYDVMEKSGILSPVLSVECEYKAMSRFPETVSIQVRLVRYTGVRFEVEYEMTGEDGTLRARAKSTHCFIDGNGRPVTFRRRFPAWDDLFKRCAESAQ